MVDNRRLRLTVRWAILLAALTFAITSLGFALSGPASNLCSAGPLRRLSGQFPGGKVFVRNPELQEELEILRASEVFEFVPASQATQVVELQPRKWAPVCGNPLLLHWLTCGLTPAAVRVQLTFSFSLEENGVVSDHQFVLEADRRVSFLQRFLKPFRDDTQTLGAILASEYAIALRMNANDMQATPAMACSE